MPTNHLGRVQRSLHVTPWVYFVCDYSFALLAVACALIWSPYLEFNAAINPWAYKELRTTAIFAPLFISIGLQIAGTQRAHSGVTLSWLVIKCLQGVCLGVLGYTVVNFIYSFTVLGRVIIAGCIIYATAFSAVFRMVTWSIAAKTKVRLLIYGDFKAAAEFTARLLQHNLPAHVVGVFDVRRRMAEGEPGSINEGLLAMCKSKNVDKIIIARMDHLLAEERTALLECTAAGWYVITMDVFSEEELHQVYIKGLSDTWFWGYNPMHAHPVYTAAKRLVDVGLAIGIAAVGAPILIAVGLCIKAQDGGPVIYRQVRTGLRNKTFTIYKLRTMGVNAESGGAQWAKLKDSRVTALGRWLRRTRIDELPQVWNILKGEMSFVGPRPERPELIQVIEGEVPFYSFRHMVKPGLSGWAQINFPYGASIEDAKEKLAFDLYYVKYASIALDLVVILRTLAAMMRGAR